MIKLSCFLDLYRVPSNIFELLCCLARKLSNAIDNCYAKCEELRSALCHIPADSADASVYYHDSIVTLMAALRAEADVLEQLTDKAYWPYPTYSDLLYY